MTEFELRGKTILVSGASSGIGRCVACKCAEAGANVILMGRNRERLEECAGELPGDVRSHMIVADLKNGTDLERHIDAAVAELGRIGGFVYSAGVASTTPLKMISVEKFLDDYTINVAAGFQLAGILALKKNLASEGASFVFISSVTAYVGTPGTVSYSATKGALQSGARAMAAELISRKIRVNTVSPGYIANTGITGEDFQRLSEDARTRIALDHPLGMGNPEDVAMPIIFLLSDAARWITGTDLCIDGGYRLKR